MLLPLLVTPLTEFLGGGGSAATIVSIFKLSCTWSVEARLDISTKSGSLRVDWKSPSDVQIHKAGKSFVTRLPQASWLLLTFSSGVARLPPGSLNLPGSLETWPFTHSHFPKLSLPIL